MVTGEAVLAPDLITAQNLSGEAALAADLSTAFLGQTTAGPSWLKRAFKMFSMFFSFLVAFLHCFLAASSAKNMDFIELGGFGGPAFKEKRICKLNFET